VVRLWEDILDILPNVLEPLPSELSTFLEQDENAWLRWESNVSDWVERQPDEDKALETYEHAIWWQRVRYLDAAYLQNSPRIWMWSTEASVIINWDNADIVVEGIQVWSATQGRYCVRRDEFLIAVRAFHDKLMSQMAQRVEQVCDRWDRAEIYVDFQNLWDQQLERETWLYYALRKSPTVNWGEMLAASRIVSADLPSSQKLR
jgi:hypothetical protein